MASIGIFYGSSTGNTKDVSVKLQAALGGDLHNITDVDADTISGYRYLVFATSTWGAGDLQDDWEDFFPTLDDVDFSGKKVGIMGLGDQENYGDTFVDGMTFSIFENDAVAGSLPGSQLVTYAIKIPAGVSPDTLKLLSWDASLNGGLGDWVELTDFTITADGYVVFTAGAGGTFVLASG